MREMGIVVETVKAGYANMFLSPLFREAFASTTRTTVEVFETDGAVGAARGAGIGAGIYKNSDEAFFGLEKKIVIEPDESLTNSYADAYGRWREVLLKTIVHVAD
jgi:xylulokinase